MDVKKQEKVLLQGWLKKQGARGILKTWKRRWFVLYQSYLKYFDKENGTLMGAIALVEIQSVVMDPETDTFCFICMCQERNYAMIADNEKDLNKWIDAVEGNRDKAAALQAEAAKDSGKSAFAVEKDGWLKKKGGRIKTWKKRWFVLTQIKLAYYENPQDDSPINVMMVTDIDVEVDTSQSDSFLFKVVTSKRTYDIIADSKEDMYGWVQAIQDVKKIEDGRIHRATTLDDSTIFGAVRKGDVDKVQEFLDEQVDPNSVSGGQTALHLACTKGSSEIVTLLTEYGADARAKSKIGQEPVHCAASKGHPRCLAVVLQAGGDIDARSSDGLKAPLHFAAIGGHDNVTKLLIEKGCDFDAKDAEGFTGLHLACVFGHEKVAQLLMSSGASVNEPNNEKRTPLHTTVMQQYTDLAGLLLRKKATINAQDKHLYTPLHCAAKTGNETVARQLVKHGAKLDAKTDEGMTALHVSLTQCQVQIAQFLTVSGADLNCKTKKGNTALHLALERVQKEDFYFKFAMMLVEGKADTNTYNEKGMGPLHIAVSKGNDKAVAFLLKHSADPSRPSGEMGMTPLHLSALQGHMQITSMLIVNGSTIDAQDSKGWTPLHYAAFTGAMSIVQVLVEHGANVNKQDKKKQTPLHNAWQKSHKEIGFFLVEHGANISTKVEKEKEESKRRSIMLGINPVTNESNVPKLMAQRAVSPTPFTTTTTTTMSTMQPIQMTGDSIQPIVATIPQQTLQAAQPTKNQRRRMSSDSYSSSSSGSYSSSSSGSDSDSSESSIEADFAPTKSNARIPPPKMESNTTAQNISRSKTLGKAPLPKPTLPPQPQPRSMTTRGRGGRRQNQGRGPMNIPTKK